MRLPIQITFAAYTRLIIFNQPIANLKADFNQVESVRWIVLTVSSFYIKEKRFFFICYMCKFWNCRVTSSHSYNFSILYDLCCMNCLQNYLIAPVHHPFHFICYWIDLLIIVQATNQWWHGISNVNVVCVFKIFINVRCSKGGKIVEWMFVIRI